MVDAHRRFRPPSQPGQSLPATRPCGPQGLDPADVGRHGPPAGSRQLADSGRFAAALSARQPGAARNEPRRHGRGARPVHGRGEAGGQLRLRHARNPHGARLSAGEFHLSGHQPAHGRIRRAARAPAAFSAGSVRRGARRVAAGAADGGAHFRHRLDAGRTVGQGCGGDRPRVQGARLRPDRRVHRPDRPGVETGLRPHVPDAVLGADPQRSGHRHHGRGRDHQRRPGEHHHRLGTRRPVRPGAAASRRSGLHPARSGRLHGAGLCDRGRVLAEAIPAGEAAAGGACARARMETEQTQAELRAARPEILIATKKQ